MSWRERTFFALATAGFIVPNTLVALFFIHHGQGLDLGAYFSHWGESLPAAQLAFDVTATFLAFAIWAAWEGRRLGMRTWWVPVPASLLVGVCFAVPLFLFIRERAIHEQQTRQEQPGRIGPSVGYSGETPVGVRE